MSDAAPAPVPVEEKRDGPIVILGDCHLAVGQPERTELVLRFLDDVSARASRIVFLGDLFDFWLGAKHLDLPDFRDVIDKLRQLTDAGLPIDLIQGNRDFLLDHHFEARTGTRLLGDYTVVESGDLKARLTHGDLLCTRDWRYRVWRGFVRRPVVKGLIGWMPLFLTLWLAVLMRKFSQSEVNRKGFSRLGFVEDAAAKVAADGVDALILGHAHDAETRTLLAGGREKPVYVAGDWKDGGTYLTIERGQIVFQAFSSEGARPFVPPHRATWNSETSPDRIGHDADTRSNL